MISSMLIFNHLCCYILSTELSTFYILICREDNKIDEDEEDDNDDGDDDDDNYDD